jgi:hypothetical protein
MNMSAIPGKRNSITRIAGIVVAAGAMGLAAIVGPAAVADASPVTKVGSDPVAPATPGGKKAPATTVGSDPVTSIVTGIAGGSGVPGVPGIPGVEIPPLVSPWPGGAWAGHDWSKGWPGGGYANGTAGGGFAHGKGGGALIRGKAGGGWLHRG